MTIIFFAIWLVISVLAGSKSAELILRGADNWLDAAGQICLLALGWYMLARQIFGEEIVRIEGDTLTIKFETFGLGWTREYALRDVHLLRVEQPWEHRMAWPDALKHTLALEDWPYYRIRPVAPVVAFEYRGREHRFGLDLDRQSAEDLIAQIREDAFRGRFR